VNQETSNDLKHKVAAATAEGKRGVQKLKPINLVNGKKETEGKKDKKTLVVHSTGER